jgi:hypothetical protein
VAQTVDLVVVVALDLVHKLRVRADLVTARPLVPHRVMTVALDPLVLTTLPVVVVVVLAKQVHLHLVKSVVVVAVEQHRQLRGLQ